MGDIVIFLEWQEALVSQLELSGSPLLVPGVFRTNVPSSALQAWTLPGIFVASPRQTPASPWSGGMAKRPSTLTELSTRPSPELTTPRSKSQGANKPQPRPHSQVSSTPQTQPALGICPPVATLQRKKTVKFPAIPLT